MRGPNTPIAITTMAIAPAMDRKTPGTPNFCKTAAMKKLVKMKYAGYVGQEFIPTRKPLEGLKQAVKVCDV